MHSPLLHCLRHESCNCSFGWGASTKSESAFWTFSNKVHICINLWCWASRSKPGNHLWKRTPQIAELWIRYVYYSSGNRGILLHQTRTPCLVNVLFAWFIKKKQQPNKPRRINCLGVRELSPAYRVPIIWQRNWQTAHMRETLLSTWLSDHLF